MIIDEITMRGSVSIHMRTGCNFLDRWCQVALPASVRCDRVLCHSIFIQLDTQPRSFRRSRNTILDERLRQKRMFVDEVSTDVRTECAVRRYERGVQSIDIKQTQINI